MDAQAVQWNFEPMMDPQTRAATRVFFKDVKELDMVDCHTTRFVLHEPHDLFPLPVGGYRLGLPISSPPAFERMSEQERWAHMVATLQVTRPPCDDLRVRQVIGSCGLNRQEIAEKAQLGFARPLVSMAPVDTKGNVDLNAICPYTQALLSAVPSARPGVMQPRIRLSGDVPSPLNPPAGCRSYTHCPKAMLQCKAEEPRWKDVGNGHYTAWHLY